MGEFLDNYVRLRDRGIRPFFCVNHGPTTSMYYRDPDGNRVELQIDNFATAEEGQAWMHSEAFDRNPIGVEYDPTSSWSGSARCSLPSCWLSATQRA
jgi:hypothetical protein